MRQLVQSHVNGAGFNHDIIQTNLNRIQHFRKNLLTLSDIKLEDKMNLRLAEKKYSPSVISLQKEKLHEHATT